MAWKSHHHTVGEFMTSAPEKLPLRSSIEEAHETMRRLNVRHMPIVDDGGTLVGILSDRDLCIVKAAHGVEPSDVGVDEVMTRDPYQVSSDTPIEEVAAEMAKGRHGSTLVVDDGEVVGIFTTTDALRALVEAEVGEQAASHP
jgi:acetoin utilization protein AcuB